MGPAAVLLLVCCLATVRAGYKRGICDLTQPCGDGWSRIDKERCAKYFEEPKTFSEAKDFCHSLKSELVSMHNNDEMFNVLCLSFRFNVAPQPFWIGAERSQGYFRWTDGTPFDYTFWYDGEPNNTDFIEDCGEMNFPRWGKWNDAKCSKINQFVCAKKM